jgi:hypothetical protein
MRVTRRTSGERKSWCTFAVSFLRPRSVVSDLGRIFSIIDIICFLLNVVGAKEKPMIRINHRLRKRRTEQSRSGEVPGRFDLFITRLKPLSRLPLRYASGTMSPKREKPKPSSNTSCLAAESHQPHQPTSPLPIWEGREARRRRRGDRSKRTRQSIVTIGVRSATLQVWDRGNAGIHSKTP